MHTIKYADLIVSTNCDILPSMKRDMNQQLTGFSREKWLETALDTLARTRKSKFNLDSLIQAMPVTKGSFYSHFRNREDFRTWFAGRMPAGGGTLEDVQIVQQDASGGGSFGMGIR